MDKVTLSRINMIGSVHDFANSEKAAPFREMVHYSELTASLSDLFNRISQAATEEAKETTGAAAQKAIYEDNLVNIASNVLKKIQAYAAINENKGLLTEFNYSTSDLKKSPDRVLVGRCKNILDKAREFFNELEPYRLTEEMLNSMENNIQQFENSISSVRLEKTSNSTVRHDLKDLVKETVLVLDNKLDRLIDTVRDEQTELCKEYDRVRRILDL